MEGLFNSRIVFERQYTLTTVESDDCAASLFEWPSAQILQCNCGLRIAVPEVVEDYADPTLRERVFGGCFGADSLIKVKRRLGFVDSLKSITVPLFIPTAIVLLIGLIERTVPHKA